MYYEKYLLPGDRGCSIVMGPTDVLMQVVEGGVMVHEFKRKKLVQERIIPELTAEKAATLRVMGVAEADAADVAQCFFYAIKNANADEFLAGVVGYALQSPKVAGMKMAVAFYGAAKATVGSVDMTESSACGGLLVGGGHA